MTIKKQITRLTPLCHALRSERTLSGRKKILSSFVDKAPPCPFPGKEDLEVAFLSLVAIGEEGVISKNPFQVLFTLKTLVEIDCFYASIGGIVGYHLKVLELLSAEKKEPPPRHFERAPALDLTTKTQEVIHAVQAGLAALPNMGEIYPIGGLGSRLNLRAPAAFLPFLGRTLLEGLIRDVEGRECLYERLFGQKILTPIAMMTSHEQDNHEQIWKLCEEKKWFGRPKETFFLFPQLSVPVVTEEGRWSTLSNGSLYLQPGGHGALWLTAEEQGVFDWFEEWEREAVLIRQINNPLAGVDNGLLALLGAGQGKALGIASCPRRVHAAEGMLVLAHNAKGERYLSNIEYTDATLHEMADALFPANTNILYADLARLRPHIRKHPLPGLLFNPKESIAHNLYGGRLESMMQNITDSLKAPRDQPLETFLTYNVRHKTLSTTKRTYVAGEELLETPEGAFYDLLKSAHELLVDHCRFRAPPFCTPEEYLKTGPTFLFLYHPALGPLYEVIAEKVQRGVLSQGAELRLELSEVKIEALSLEGSLHIVAQDPSPHGGRCTLKNVSIRNRGIDHTAKNTYWKDEIHYHEKIEIILKGTSAFEMEGVTLEGNKQFVVPDGERWILTDSGIHKESFLIKT